MNVRKPRFPGSAGKSQKGSGCAVQACDLIALTVEGTRMVEQSVFRRVDSYSVMRQAGEQVAKHAAERLQGNARVLVLAGPGNNGGDGFIAAAELRRRGAQADVAFCGGKAPPAGDAARAIAAWKDAGGKATGKMPDIGKYGLVIDGLFGIGLSKPLAGTPLEWARTCNRSGIPVLSVDVPSGLSADTGQDLGDAIRAAATVTFFGCKPGLLMSDGPDCAGEPLIEPLGMVREDLPGGREEGRVLDGISPANPYRRRSGSNKSTHGTVEVVGGATGMVGALALAARAALALGAGKVRAVSLHRPCPAYDPLAPEAMWSGKPAAGADCRAIGPGLGTAPGSAEAFREAIADSGAPLVVDADALNLLARKPALGRSLARRRAGSLVITPHPGEAGRLLRSDAGAVQENRIEAALLLAEKFRGVVALKGAGTVCAAPDGRWWVNRSGNAGLASGGSGDVLTGMIASLAAQSGDALQATLDAVWLHGRAAERMAERSGGLRGVSIGGLAAAAAAELDDALQRGQPG